MKRVCLVTLVRNIPVIKEENLFLILKSMNYNRNYAFKHFSFHTECSLSSDFLCVQRLYCSVAHVSFTFSAEIRNDMLVLKSQLL